jgi:hypothetical protein
VYTKSCPLIQEHQNCLKYGRPDLGFLRWQWRPAGCEMPRFDAAAFLDAVRGRSLAFVGDSLARNHMQSLMCFLTKVTIQPSLYRYRPFKLSSTENKTFYFDPFCRLNTPKTYPRQMTQN